MVNAMPATDDEPAKTVWLGGRDGRSEHCG